MISDGTKKKPDRVRFFCFSKSSVGIEIISVYFVLFFDRNGIIVDFFAALVFELVVVVVVVCRYHSFVLLSVW